MKVVAKPLEGSPLEQLVVTEPGASDHVAGEALFFFCRECEALDETARQLYHAADCSHAGEGGRRFYRKSDYVDDSVPSPEFEADTEAFVIEYGETEGRGGRGLHAGEVLGFECICGMADESLFGVMHAECCPLAHCETMHRT
jgi:hypothetical protein